MEKDYNQNNLANYSKYNTPVSIKTKRKNRWVIWSLLVVLVISAISFGAYYVYSIKNSVDGVWTLTDNSRKSLYSHPSGEYNEELVIKGNSFQMITSLKYFKESDFKKEKDYYEKDKFYNVDESSKTISWCSVKGTINKKKSKIYFYSRLENNENKWEYHSTAKFKLNKGMISISQIDSLIGPSNLYFIKVKR